MAQYVDKIALVAEIENLENIYKKCPARNSYEEGLKDGRLIGYKDALYKINTLEVKDVDLEEEIDEVFFKRTLKEADKLTHKQLMVIAKHFFELGLNIQNRKENK